MIIELDAAAVGRDDLPPVSLRTDPARVNAIATDTDEHPLLLSLVIAGRLRLSSGDLRVDDAMDTSELRRRVALVDTPVVSEAAPALRVGTVVAEELALADRPCGRRAVREALQRAGLAASERSAFRTVPAAARVRLLVALALERAGVDALVLTSPERHGGDAADWFPALADAAERGVAVIVVSDVATRDRLIALGAVDPTLVGEGAAS